MQTRTDHALVDRELSIISPQAAQPPVDTALPPPTNETPLSVLVWLKDGQNQHDARQIVEHMLSAAWGPFGKRVSIAGDDGLAWGMLLPDTPAPLSCWSTYRRDGEVCLVEGDVYEDPPGLKLLPGENRDLARWVAARLQRSPHQPMRELNGLYSVIYVNRDRSCASVCGDRTGSHPIYWLSDSKRLVVSSNLWAFRGCDGIEPRWDTMALTQLLTIGFPLAGRTCLAGVKHLQRGRQVRSWADGRTEVRQLQAPVPRQAWSLAQSVQALHRSLDEAVKRLYRRLDAPPALALSGGIDSRLLLASLHTQGLDHHNLTHCIDTHEADIRVAPSVAAHLGEPHRTVVLDRLAAEALHRDLLLLTEGDSFGFGFPMLAAEARQQTTALMLGYETSRITPPGSFDPMSLSNVDELARRMLRGYMQLFTPQQTQLILDSPYRVGFGDVMDEWFDSFRQIQQPSITDVCLAHMTDYSHQRRIRPRIDAARWFCLPVYPYLDNHVYETLCSLPLAYLHGDRAHLALLGDYHIGLERLPSAARRFHVPIMREYRYHHLIHVGRILEDKLTSPLRRGCQACKAACGLGERVLEPALEVKLARLRHCRLLHWPAVQQLIERARRGAFTNRAALYRLTNVAYLDEFLFASIPQKRGSGHGSPPSS